MSPETILPTDADEVAELAALGVVLAPATEGAPAAIVGANDLASYQAAAAFYLRRIRQVAQERAVTEAAMRKEQASIERAYGPQLAAADRQRAYLEGRVRELAQFAEAAGAFEKRKTLKTSAGEFGTRRKPERWEITDPEATRRWAEQTVPEAVRVTVQLPLSLYEEIITARYVDEEGAEVLPASWVEKKREVLVKGLEEAGIVFGAAEIPGVSHVPASTEYVVKPNLEDLP